MNIYITSARYIIYKMVYCCVPHCTSKSGKVKGISFHEFPCDPELKQKWLKNISRDNFVPNFESRTSFVCGLHFLDADYRPDLKIKKLKQNAIPSVFKGYPPNKIPKPIPQRRVLIKHEVKKNKKRKRDESFGDNYECPISDGNNEDDVENTINCSRSVEVQTDSEAGKYYKAEREKTRLRLKLWRANQKIKKLENDLQVQKERMNQFHNKYHSNVEAIIESNKQDPTDSKSSFILEQILNYYKQSPRWSENCIKQCVIWQFISPKGYSYARNNLLKLPSISTLNRYLGDVSCETGVTELVRERLLAESERLNGAEKLCSLIIDEMAIKQQFLYDKKLDTFVGHKDTSSHVEALRCENNSVSKAVTDKEPVLANSLLCFLISGISTCYRIPVAYFFF